jgi:hypothetical protein
VAAIAGVGDQTLDGVADQGLHGGNDGRQSVAVIGIARQSGDVSHELTAF